MEKTCKLRRGDKVYCGLVVISYILAPFPFSNDISAFIGLLLLILLPVGIVFERFQKRWPPPWPVAVCIFSTIVWTILVIKVNLENPKPNFPLRPRSAVNSQARECIFKLTHYGLLHLGAEWHTIPAKSGNCTYATSAKPVPIQRDQPKDSLEASSYLRSSVAASWYFENRVSERIPYAA